MTITTAVNKIAFSPLTASLGASVAGVDLADGITSTQFELIHDAFIRYQVLVFQSSREISEARQVEFARFFGEVQIHVMNQYHASEFPELYTLSNLDEHGNPGGKHPDKGTLAWHTDASWMRNTGLATFMFAVEVPDEGGETHFADMHGAWDRLDHTQQKALSQARAIHNLDFSRTRRHGADLMTEAQKRAAPPVDHPICRTHPVSGRKSLFLGDHAETIVGMPYEEGRAQVDALNAESIHDDLVYKHRWQPNQLVVWDNRSVLHIATPYDVANARRVIRRCTVLGDPPR